MIGRLGSGAFETIGGIVITAALVVIGRDTAATNSFSVIDAEDGAGIAAKAMMLASGPPSIVDQADQARNHARITAKTGSNLPLLSRDTSASQGISTGDADRIRSPFLGACRS